MAEKRTGPQAGVVILRAEAERVSTIVGSTTSVMLSIDTAK
jgi:hypothetical protein